MIPFLLSGSYLRSEDPAEEDLRSTHGFAVLQESVSDLGVDVQLTPEELEQAVASAASATGRRCPV